MTFNTGDIVLFYASSSWLSRLISLLSFSDYSHVGMVIRDPSWIEEGGTYIIQSGMEPMADVETHMRRLDVSMFKLDEVVSCYQGTVSVRRLIGPAIRMDRLAEIHTSVHAVDYNLNPFDWLMAGMDVTSGPETDRRFWCSALVAYIYNQLELLPSHYPYSYTKPSAFGRYGSSLPLSDGYSLGPVETIKS